MSLRMRITLFITLIFVAFPLAAQVRILAYGDSNTWGWKPVIDGNQVPRYSDEERWPGIMQSAIGSAYKIEVNGLIGRTLDVDLAEGIGQLEGGDHNGIRRLALSLEESAPINLVIVMLGTNDLIEGLNRDPKDIAKSLSTLAEIVNKGTSPYANHKHPRLLVVVPPPLSDTSRTPFKDLFNRRSIDKSKLLAAEYERAGAEYGFAVFNAGDIVEMDGVDGLHLSLAAHKRLGKAIAKHVLQLFSKTNIRNQR